MKCNIFLRDYPPGGSGWIIGVGWLGNSSTPWGRREWEKNIVFNIFAGGGEAVPARAIIIIPYFLFFCARIISFHTHASFLTFFCFFVLFHSCCSHACVFEKTLLHEFYIFYFVILKGTCFFRCPGIDLDLVGECY